MSKIRLHGSSSGYTEIAPVAASGNNTITLPNDGTIISKDAAGAVGVTSIKSSNVNVGAAVTITESGIEASGIGITCANINGTQIGGRRNLMINGGMNVNQYGSSSTTSMGKQIFDRWHPNSNGGTITQSKETITSGGAYDAGHRSALRLTNTSAAGSGSGTYVEVYYKWEAQDIAKSGWNYKSSSSHITLSFWLRSSVAQTYSCTLSTRDGTTYFHPFTAVISSANTWTKITKTFAGNSNLTINDDNGDGLMMWVNPMQGSNFHNSSWNTNGWFAASGSYMFAGTTDTTWGTTAGATWDITGFQFEVGSQATPFEHRSFGEELALCQRYFYPYLRGTYAYENITLGFNYNGSAGMTLLMPPVEMRSSPTLTTSGTIGADDDTSIGFSFEAQGSTRCFRCNITSFSKTSGQGFQLRAHNDTSAKFQLDAEL